MQFTHKATLGALLTVGGLTAQPVHAQFGTNLVLNGDAEAGPGSQDGSIVPVPDWTTTGNFTVVKYGGDSGDPSATSPGPTDRGSNFFSGGLSNTSSSAAQIIDVMPEATAIDSGHTSFTLSGYLGGYYTQDDNAVFSATFLSASNSVLDTKQIGPVLAFDRNDVTGLVFRSIDGFIPSGTRSIDMKLQLTRKEGSYNDGLADNLSLVLQNQSAPVPEASTTVSFGLLLCLGLGGMVWSVRRKKAQAGE